MVVIQVPAGVAPCQVEFPEFKPRTKEEILAAKKAKKTLKDVKLERSHPGALHLRPGSTKTVTKDELEHLQKHEKGIVFRVVTLELKEKKPEKAKATDEKPDKPDEGDKGKDKTKPKK